jgi:kynurenine 3-monooxygenase
MTDFKNINDLIIIIGGGPAGLGAALAFNNNGYKNITVLEGLKDMNFDVDNSYTVGVNVRGKNALAELYADSEHKTNIDSLGLRVDQWKIIVGPGINVANFDSGLVSGTSRAEVTQILYDETQRRNGAIKVLFDHKGSNVDLKTKTLKCVTSSGEEKEFQPKCLVIADGYRSKIRDLLAESDKSLQIKQWPWTLSFRVLTTTSDKKTTLDPYIHYIQNQVYISRFLNGRWSAVLSMKEDSPLFLRSNDPTDANVDELIKYVNKMAPPAAELFSREEMKSYFTRKIFSGAVTKVSKLVIDDWAVLIGDAAHSTIPATGEGMEISLFIIIILLNCCCYF